MPVAYVQEFRIVDGDHSTSNYDALSARLGADVDPPEGLIVHSAGFDDAAGVFRIFDVWESPEHQERFVRDRLGPLIEEMRASRPNFEPPTREALYGLHDVIAGRVPARA